MKKETEFGPVEYGGEYVSSPYSPLDTADTAPDQLPLATPYLTQSLTRTAKLWRQLYPGATQQQRIDLMLLIGRELGVEACECIRG
ncbi:MAG: hypothetical protein [Caudoviricetes sp.]|nr:MAG: hypothetical protein [Caudoviricetes sp.]